jgi:acyl-CoA hydrolase
MTRPATLKDAEAVADRIIAETGGDVRLAMPIGIGKPNHLVNALYERARADRSIHLTIFTGLTLEVPVGSNDLERRFVGPLVERLFQGYPDLAYAKDLRSGGLPPNVQVNEFFLQAGRWLGNRTEQRSYISANYTHAAGYGIEAGVNVFAQLVAPGEGRYSVSSNSDLTLDVLDQFRFRGGPIMLVGQVNREMPFMPGAAALEAEAFDVLLDDPEYDFAPFAPPNMPLGDTDHAIGIRAAALVPDGGSIQIGIGGLGDAFGNALLMRHEAPDLFRETLARLGGSDGGPLVVTGPFEQGLYGISEMLVPVFLPLYRRGVLKRRASDGALLHGAFFIGPRNFYQALRDLPEEERALFQMRGVGFTNQLYGGEAERRRDRVHARFVNNAMLVTALGAVTSDSIEDGRVVSGVGGQYNFVAQAFALDGARSIMTLPATRESKGETLSNVHWSYGHTTIPRHLRDVVVTEYGVADLRGRTDRDCVAATLGVTDGRFQGGIIDKAKSVGKLEQDFRLPPEHSENAPERIAEALAPAREAGWCVPYPFGTDLTAEEQRLVPALARLKAASEKTRATLAMAASAALERAPDDDERRVLGRLGLDAPEGVAERAMQRAVLWGLRAEDRSE